MRTRLVDEIVNVILLALVVLPPALSVTAASLDRSPPFGMLGWVALAALLVGTLGAYSRAPSGLVHLGATAGGFAVIVYLIARVHPGLPETATLSERLSAIVGEIGS